MIETGVGVMAARILLKPEAAVGYQSLLGYREMIDNIVKGVPQISMFFSCLTVCQKGSAVADD